MDLVLGDRSWLPPRMFKFCWPTFLMRTVVDGGGLRYEPRQTGPPGPIDHLHLPRTASVGFTLLVLKTLQALSEASHAPIFFFLYTLVIFSFLLHFAPPLPLPPSLRRSLHICCMIILAKKGTEHSKETLKAFLHFFKLCVGGSCRELL